jgi:hypothetical protein
MMRVWIDEVLLARGAVGTVIADQYFAGLGAWSTANTTSGAVASVAAGVCTLGCLPVGGLAQIKQTVTVAGADQGKEHGIRIVVTNGPVTLRAGLTPGASDVITQTVLDTGTHSLSCPPSGNFTIEIESTDGQNKTLTACYIEPAGPVVVPTPWAAGDLANIRYDQSGDEIFVACYGQQQQIIQRRGTRPGARGWSVAAYRSNDGPFQNTAGIEANFTPGAYAGNTTLASDRPWFQPGHVGALFRLFSNGQANQTILGNQNAFTPPVRVVGVGTTARNYSWTSTGTFVGTQTLQRSFDGPTSGFVDVTTHTDNTGFSSATGGSAGTPSPGSGSASRAAATPAATPRWCRTIPAAAATASAG